MYQKKAKQLLDFIKNSPSCFHVIQNMKKELDEAGFQEIKERDCWHLEAGGKYYVTRNDSSIIAFKIPCKDFHGFQIMASHSDAPAFKVKENPENVCVHCVLDNEEVGSGTKQGAASTFLKDTLMRINRAMDRTEEQYHTALASGFMISADNAHAAHPNKGEKSDPTNRPYPNGGIVIKFSGSQKYTTDAVSAAILRMICEKAEVPVQVYLNHSDIPGGSTLGNISSTQVPLNTADIGVAQLAMHSPYETGGVKDVTYLIQMAKTFFGSCIILNGDDSYEIR